MAESFIFAFKITIRKKVNPVSSKKKKKGLSQIPRSELNL